MEGWIKLHRKLIQWEWIDEPNMVWLFLKCLLLANHKDEKWHGITIKKGSFVTSYANLASRKGHISIQNIRTLINHLKSTNEITTKTSNQYTIVTVKNYDEYQGINTQTNKRSTHDQHTIN